MNNQNNQQELNQADLILQSLIDFMLDHEESSGEMFDRLHKVINYKGLLMSQEQVSTVLYNAICFKVALDLEVNSIGDLSVDDERLKSVCDNIKSGEFKEDTISFISKLIPNALIQFSIPPKLR